MRDGGTVRVPSVVLAECYGDARHNARYDRALNVLGGIDRAVIDISATIAKEAGRILRAARMRETIDALVVAATAVLSMPATVVTADESHVERLAHYTAGTIGVIQLNSLPSS